MYHPHGEWTRERLEGYLGTTETLTLEFKSVRALLADNKRDKNGRIQDAAVDVAAMANEQGGVIVYGIEERKKGEFYRAVHLEDGFGPEDKVSRSWFLQFVRDRVHPCLPDIDAVEVPLDQSGERFALVVLVPQARGVARQTDDFVFWRRDAQGRHKMTVQEIEDVRSRTVRPRLDLSAFVARHTPVDNNRLQELRTQFRITNPSTMTAYFAVITLGLIRDSTATFVRGPEWRWVQTGEDWKIARCVLASGSSVDWSPITPGFTLAAPALTVRTPF